MYIVLILNCSTFSGLIFQVKVEAGKVESMVVGKTSSMSNVKIKGRTENLSTFYFRITSQEKKHVYQPRIAIIHICQNVSTKTSLAVKFHKPWDN